MPLDDEELAEARAAEARETAGDRSGTRRDPVVGELVIRRRARDWIFFWVLGLLAPIVWQLGQPIVGAAIGAVVALGFFVHRARRIARVSIGADGSLALPGHAEIDWTTLQALHLEYRYPWAAASKDKAHDETLHIVFTPKAGPSITLAEGALWRIRPTRAPVGAYALDRWLKARAREAGLTIEGKGGGRGGGKGGSKAPKGWIARRHAPRSGV